MMVDSEDTTEVTAGVSSAEAERADDAPAIKQSTVADVKNLEILFIFIIPFVIDRSRSCNRFRNVCRHDSCKFLFQIIAVKIESIDNLKDTLVFKIFDVCQCRLFLFGDIGFSFPDSIKFCTGFFQLGFGFFESCGHVVSSFKTDLVYCPDSDAFQDKFT